MTISASSYLTKHRPTVAFLLSLFLLFCLAPATGQATETLTVAVQNAPSTLNPLFATDTAAAQLLRLTSPALVKLNDAFQPVPLVAAKLSRTPDARTYTVTLRHGLRYHDGTALTAPLVRDYLEEVRDTRNGSPMAGLLKEVERLSTPASDTLVFRLLRPVPTFWLSLEQIPLDKPACVRSAADAAHNAPATAEKPACLNKKRLPIGLGTFQLKKLENDGGVVLERTVNANNLPFVTPPSGSLLHTLKFIVVKDPTVRLLKVLRGEADIAHDDLPEELYDYGMRHGLTGVTTPAASYSYLGLNMRSPVLQKKPVRQALSQSINRDALIAYLLKGNARPADSLLTATHPARWAAPLPAYNPTQAAALLESAGFKANKQGERLTLTLSVSNSPFILRAAQLIQSDMKKAGINLVIRSAEWGTFYKNVREGNYELCLLNWTGRFDTPIFYDIFHSANRPPMGANRGAYSNPRMDALLESLQQEPNDKKRYALAQEVQKLQAEDIIYIPLWKRNHASLARPGVSGYGLDEEGSYAGLLTVR